MENLPKPQTKLVLCIKNCCLLNLVWLFQTAYKPQFHCELWHSEPWGYRTGSDLISSQGEIRGSRLYHSVIFGGKLTLPDCGAVSSAVLPNADTWCKVGTIGQFKIFESGCFAITQSKSHLSLACHTCPLLLPFLCVVVFIQPVCLLALLLHPPLQQFFFLSESLSESFP